jgi:hypothetical protein
MSFLYLDTDLKLEGGHATFSSMSGINGLYFFFYSIVLLATKMQNTLIVLLASISSAVILITNVQVSIIFNKPVLVHFCFT